MQQLTQETYAEAIKGGKVVLVITGPGCSNCARMKPLLEQYETENPDIKFCTIEVEYDEKTKLPQKWQLELLPSKWTFPVVQCFSNEKKMFQIGGLFPVDILGNAFLPEQALQANYANSVLMVEMMKKDHQNTLNAIYNEQRAMLYVLKRQNQIKNNIPDDEWELPEPTINESDKKTCEACQ